MFNPNNLNTDNNEKVHDENKKEFEINFTSSNLTEIDKREEIKSVKNIEDEKNYIQKDLEPWSSFLKKWVLKFLKVFSVRAIITILKNKKLLTSLKFYELFKAFFGLSNMRTVAAITLIPIFFKALNHILRIAKFFTPEINRLISIFVSSFLCIIMEERTQLVNYVILAVIVRVMHNLMNLLFKKLNIFQEDSKFNNYLAFTMSSIFWFLSIFLNPSFEPISKLSDKYSNYTPSEVREMTHIRAMTRLDL